MRKSRLEEPTLKKQVINRLVQGDKQWDIARSVGLHQSQVSRFATKHQKRIELKRMKVEFDRDMRVFEMALKFQRKAQPPPGANVVISPALMKLLMDLKEKEEGKA